MPQALFPALATTLFGGGAFTLGFLYVAPAREPRRGAHLRLGLPDPASGARGHCRGHHVGHRHHLFGLVPWLPGALALLAVADWADVVSAVFRSDHAAGRARRATGAAV